MAGPSHEPVPTQMEAPRRNARTTNKAAKPADTIPINIVGNQPRFNIHDFLLNMPVTLPVYQLLDRSPQIRAQMAKQLQSSQLARRAKKTTVLTEDTVVQARSTVKIIDEGFDEDAKVTCLYIEAHVNGVKTTRALVDSGAVVELISPQLIVKLPGIKVHDMTQRWSLRLANDLKTPITEYVLLEVVVAGIQTVVTAYIMGANETYEVLLSKN